MRGGILSQRIMHLRILDILLQRMLENQENIRMINPGIMIEMFQCQIVPRIKGSQILKKLYVESDEDSGDESDDSEPGCFEDHIRDGEGWNRRMRKISLAWWRINKNQKTLDVETEPKLDVHDDPLVRYLKSLNESSENWDEEKKIVMGMATVLKSCRGRNHVSKALVSEIARISDDAALKAKIAEVLHLPFFFNNYFRILI